MRRCAARIGALFLALASSGCAIVSAGDARDAWSARGPLVTESMLPTPEAWTVTDRPRSRSADFWRWVAGAWNIGGHNACGTEDDACAARLRSAPIHAGDWQNRFPTL